MAELHVQRKKNKLWWLWIIVILMIAAFVYIYILRNNIIVINNAFNVNSVYKILKAGNDLMYA